MEVTKKSLIDGLVSVCARIPEDRVVEVEQAIRDALAPNIPADIVLQDSTPGAVLRGARGLRELTQKKLAEMIGVHKLDHARKIHAHDLRIAICNAI